MLTGLKEAELSVETGYSVNYIWRDTGQTSDFFHCHCRQIAKPFLHWLKGWYQDDLTTLQWGERCAVRDGPWGGAFGHQDWAHDYEYDVNFQLKSWIPEPAAFTGAAGLLLGLAGIALRRWAERR